MSDPLAPIRALIEQAIETFKILDYLGGLGSPMHELIQQHIEELSAVLAPAPKEIRVYVPRAEVEERHPLTDWMAADTPQKRDAAFLRMYAAKVRDKTAALWEIPNTVASTLEDIANRIQTDA